MTPIFEQVTGRSLAPTMLSANSRTALRGSKGTSGSTSRSGLGVSSLVLSASRTTARTAVRSLVTGGVGSTLTLVSDIALAR